MNPKNLAMRTIHIFILCTLAFSFIFFSCSQEEVDKEPPVITFVLPKDKDTIAVGGDSLRMEFKITDNKNLKYYSYVIKDTSENKFITNASFVKQTSVGIMKYVIFAGFGGIQKMELFVTAYDQSNNTKVSSRVFYVKP